MADVNPMLGGGVSITAPKAGPAKPDTGGVREIRIRVADGGFIVSVDKDSEGEGPIDRPKDRVIATPEELHSFIDENLGTAPAEEAVPPAMPPGGPGGFPSNMPPPPANPNVKVTESEPLPDEMPRG